jgi:hypothetical protein
VSLRTDVVALYVDPRGPYPSLVAEWYDEARDARTYAGPWPVVAHPPCGPWGNFRHMCTKQDESLAPLAVRQVRRWGGVLEHPYGSRLFGRTLPKPGELPDAWGGFTIDVQQVAWGHCCVKPTRLYVVGAPMAHVLAGLRTGGRPTHRMTNGPRGCSANHELKRASAQQSRRTPPAFAEWLIDLAARASRRGGSRD